MSRPAASYRAARRKLARDNDLPWRALARRPNPYDAVQVANRQLDRDMDKAIRDAGKRAGEV
jgi:hypothetical protein